MKITKNSSSLDFFEIKNEIKVIDNSIWLTRDSISAIFGISIIELNLIISDILIEATLESGKCIRKISNDITKSVYTFFSIDMIISIGYRIKAYSKIKSIININRSLKNSISRNTNNSSIVTNFKTSISSCKENLINKSIYTVQNTLNYVKSLEKFSH